MHELLVPRNCFAALFDIVGFRALRSSIGTTGLYQRYQRGILPMMLHSAAGKSRTEELGDRNVSVPDFTELSVEYRIISDTVIFFTADDSFQSFCNILRSSHALVKSGFATKAPYRGAIGWGDLVDDPLGVLLGSAIEDAYAGESMQAWAGVMLTSTCREIVEKNEFAERHRAMFKIAAANIKEEIPREKLLRNSRILVKYNVPTQANPKDGPVSYSDLQTFALDWTIGMYRGAAGKAFMPSENPHAQTIARNTVAFEDWARANNL